MNQPRPPQDVGQAQPWTVAPCQGNARQRAPCGVTVSAELSTAAEASQGRP
jgi:hypothetical protein